MNEKQKKLLEELIDKKVKLAALFWKQGVNPAQNRIYSELRGIKQALWVMGISLYLDENPYTCGISYSIFYLKKDKKESEPIDII